jgi:hypothetical protein
MDHPAGDPNLPDRIPREQRRWDDFDYFSINLADQAAIQALAARHDALCEVRGGVGHGSRG